MARWRGCRLGEPRWIKYGKATVKPGRFYRSGEFVNFCTGTTENSQSTIYGIINHEFIQASEYHPGFTAFSVRAPLPTSDEQLWNITSMQDSRSIKYLPRTM
jgi:hypothetical protein